MAIKFPHFKEPDHKSHKDKLREACTYVKTTKFNNNFSVRFIDYLKSNLFLFLGGKLSFTYIYIR